jgi:hypothetical protein
MSDAVSCTVTRLPVAPEPLLDTNDFQYADSFELRFGRPDQHTAEQWLRTGLEQPMLRQLIVLVHRRVLRFDLGPRDDEHILGWRILTSQHDVVQLEADGPLMRAVIVARRTSPTSAVATTFVFYKRPITALLWRLVGPLHRRVAPYLLKRAAGTLLRESIEVAR